MYAPKLNNLEIKRETIQEFKGYNHNLRIADNEFYDMHNLTGKYYPVLSPRAKRGVYIDNKEPIHGIASKDKLAWVSTDENGNDCLNYNGKTFVLNEVHNGKERQFVSMGAYLIVYPDMWYLNTADLNDYGSCFAPDFEYDGETTFQLLGEDGVAISAFNMIWGDEFFPRIMYIDPTAEEYSLFGIPTDNSYYTHGKYNIHYTTQITFSGYATYGEYYLFSLTEYDGKVVLKAIKPDGLDVGHAQSYEEHITKIINTINNVGWIAFGYINVTATVTDSGGDEIMSETRRILLRGKFDNSGQQKFFKSGIEVGDRRMWFEDGTTYSQICVKAEESPEGTFATPSCWRKENTTVRVTTNSEFTNKLSNIYSDNESHLITISSANIDGKGYATAPLIAEYSNNSNLAKVATKVINSTEVDINGFLDFFPTIDKQSGTIDIKISAMQMQFDYIIESNNRLWACRYGTDYKGDFVNEIYASAFGSFKAFYKFDGTDADSYVMSLGAGGAFTGAVNLGGHPIFFKENSCHIIYGSTPSSYQLSTELGTWVAQESYKSIAIDGDILYFHGRDGIYAYDGASKQMISGPLGAERYKAAVGGCVEGKYYISMKDSKGEYSLFVFDKSNGLWYKEDRSKALFFAPYGGDLYMVSVDNQIIALNGSQGVLEDDVEWSAETGRIGFVSPDSSYIGKLQIKMTLPIGSSLRIYIQYDSDGYWEFKGAIEGRNAVSFPVPIMPRRCDHFSIKLSGTGDCKVYSITKTYEHGGEI